MDRGNGHLALPAVVEIFERPLIFLATKALTMKNVQFTSRDTDYKFLAALALLTSFAVAGIFAGLFMPTGFGGIHEAPCILAAISVGLVLFVWSVFRLIKPAGYDRNWQIAGIVLVPLYWLLLLLAVDISLGWLVDKSIQEMQDIVASILRF